MRGVLGRCSSCSDSLPWKVVTDINTGVGISDVDTVIRLIFVVEIFSYAEKHTKLFYSKFLLQQIFC